MFLHLHVQKTKQNKTNKVKTGGATLTDRNE